ncbi:EamA family transporter RarD [Natronoglycomyces albus]|uniref:EamA family transporter RarD n=1 Tax=Natronoglycomyces albus TaxID=2811108 RepID=A0A895XF71_9ACTN|nr:EamA family transporter RarD [Natronoglycomyces albus]QSB04491.1 EamA family transporter RarD [Natronoglycomyces albus]
MNHSRIGYVYGVLAYVLWGLFPVYWKLLAPASALEILAHRVLWSTVFTALILVALRQFAQLKKLKGQNRKIIGISVAAVLISINWGVYIYGVHIDRVVETALGYFINPLFFVLAGLLFFKEKLRPIQWVAVGLGGMAVLILTYDYGRPPWIALILASCFAAYGAVKKRIGFPAAQGLFIESAAATVPALFFLVWLTSVGEDTFTSLGWGHALLLASGGVATAVPLLFFAGAANRIPMVAIGLLQYIAPTLHFLTGVFLFNEPMTAISWMGFSLVWLALLIFSTEAIHHTRRNRHTPMSRPETDEPTAVELTANR